MTTLFLNRLQWLRKNIKSIVILSSIIDVNAIARQARRLHIKRDEVASSFLLAMTQWRNSAKNFIFTLMCNLNPRHSVIEL